MAFLCASIIALVFSLSILLSISVLDQIHAAEYPYEATLTGQNEVPPVESNANGQAEFTLPANGIIKYRANVTGISNASAAHIHMGKAGENGDVIVDLLNNPESKDKDTAYGMIFRGNISDSILTGPMQGKTLDDLTAAIKSGDAYVNVHTSEHPDGEIRGQLLNADSLLVSTTIRAQANWLDTCKSIEWGLVYMCDRYVNPDGSLSQEGVRANNCIMNGALLSGAGVLVGRSPTEIISLLEPAAALTGCGGIVDFVKLKQATDPSSFLKALGIG